MGKLGVIFRSWRNTNIIMIALISTFSFAVYYGNLADRITNNLFKNTGDLFQELGLGGWGVSYLLSMIIAIGPLTYWASSNNFDLVISLLLIYLLVGLTIGRVMKGYPSYGGFLLGFFTPIYLNYAVYGILLSMSKAEGGYLIMSIVKGVYGTNDIEAFLTIGGIINGIALGLFGFLWAALINSRSTPDSSLVKKCSALSNYCLVVKKRGQNSPVVFKRF